MAYSVVYRPQKGQGTVYLRKKSSALPKKRIGNCSVLNLNITEKVDELVNYESQGVYARDSIIEKIGVNYTLHDFDALALARALFGTDGTVATGSVTNEAHTVYQSGLVRLAHIMPSAVTVTNAAGTTTYVEGTDYELKNAGLLILGGAITDGQVIHVDYTYPAYETIEALTKTAEDVEITFDGLNRVAGGTDIFGRTGKPIILDIYKAQFGPAKELAMIGDGFGALEFEGALLPDLSIIGNGISQYLKISQAA